jgi:hypothetical protein
MTRPELLRELGCPVTKSEHDWCEDRGCELCWPSGKTNNRLFFEMHHRMQTEMLADLAKL